MFHYVPLLDGLLKNGNPDACKPAGWKISQLTIVRIVLRFRRGQFQILKLKSQNLSTERVYRPQAAVQPLLSNCSSRFRLHVPGGMVRPVVPVWEHGSGDRQRLRNHQQGLLHREKWRQVSRSRRVSIPRLNCKWSLTDRTIWNDSIVFYPFTSHRNSLPFLLHLTNQRPVLRSLPSFQLLLINCPPTKRSRRRASREIDRDRDR